MKARLFVVNPETIGMTLKNKEVSVVVPEPQKESWHETIIDIASDLLQVEIGDYIFLWESGTKKIYGVYRAVSKPYYKKQKGRNDIFRIKFDVAYEFQKPIMEYDVINNPYMKNKLWNIVGKKVAGKARGTTPITPEETQFLIQSLIDANDSYRYCKDYNVVDVKKEILFDLEEEFRVKLPASISNYNYKPFAIRVGKEVKYEKALEGILNYLFRERSDEQITALGIDVENVVWYANYLPYGLERSEIDYMVMESDDKSNVNRIDVIELMSKVVDEDHIRRCLQYSKWVGSSVSNGMNIIRPILICGDKSRKSKNGLNSDKIRRAISELPEKYGFKNIEIFTYIIEEGEISFEKYEIE